jgi:hypothetical protein
MTTKGKIYISTPEVAKLLGVKPDTARKWLIRQRAARKIGGRWYTTREMMIAAFPEVSRLLSR